MRPLPVRAIRRGITLACCVLGCGLVLVGCGFGQVGPSSGPSTDPGNAHLHQLEHDPVFAKLPPGSELAGPIVDQAAYFDNEGPFGNSAWQGPSVTENFTSTSTPGAVANFVNKRALAAGWVFVTGTPPRVWTKKLSGSDVEGHNVVYLTLYNSGTGGVDSFQLTASA